MTAPANLAPQVGTFLHYHPMPEGEASQSIGQPLLAMVTHVHSDEEVNIALWDANGSPAMGGRQHVPLLAEDKSKDKSKHKALPVGGYCTEAPPREAKKPKKKEEAHHEHHEPAHPPEHEPPHHEAPPVFEHDASEMHRTEMPHTGHPESER